MALRPKIHQAVAGPRVEPKDGRTAGQEGDVGDAANIDYRAVLGSVAKGNGVERGYQGRPLAAGGQIPASKIRDHANFRELRQQGRIADLEREATIGAVPHSLAMTSNRPDIGSYHPGSRENKRHCLCVVLREGAAQASRPFDLIESGRCEFEQRIAQRCFESDMRVRDNPKFAGRKIR